MLQAMQNITLFAQTIKNCAPGATDPSCQTMLPQVSANDASVKIILQLVFGIISAATVIFILVSSLKFVTSQGDPQSIAKARQSILYAIIGLVIALSAEAIVTFTLGRI